MSWHSSWKNALKLTIALTVTSCLLITSSPFISAKTYNVQEITSTRTKQEILMKYDQYKPQSFTPDQFFKIEPNYSAPHRAGQLNDNILQDALNAVNFARYLAGLPDDITLDYSLAKQQQAGAVLMAELETITHYPSKPTGMAEDFFQLGAKAAKTSNLSAGRDSLYKTVFFGYMADNSASNLETVGHRRWIINPQMKKTMFGLAYNPDSYYSYYSTMYAFNRDRSSDEVSYQYIAWPSAGFFPTEILTTYDPWSITLNPEHYDLTSLNEAYVTIERERDNKQWTLDKTNKDKDGDFFTVELSGYGVANAIIFRPSDIGAYLADDVYHVTLHNIYTVDGQKTSISYSTQLFNLQATFQNNAIRYALVGQQLTFPTVAVEGKVMNFSSSDPNIASVDQNGVVTAHKEGRVTIYVDNYLQKNNSSIRLKVTKQPYGPIQEWAKSSILKANEIGLLSFDPYSIDLSSSVTREEFVYYVTSLLRALQINIEKSRYYGQTSPFTDVDYYNNDILWAYEHDIISGTGKGKFSPSTIITREQAATLLLNVYHYLNGNEKPNAVKPFADEDKISGWAKTSVKRAAELSIMGATNGKRFDPKGKYSHEQTIVTMLRLYQKFANASL